MQKFQLGSVVTFINSNDAFDNTERFIVGMVGHVVNVSSETKNGEYIYTVRVGLTDIKGVKESDLRNPNEEKESLVDSYLREAQKNKKFQDTEKRVGGSAKEKRAWKNLTSGNLSKLEENEADAIQAIVKDKIYPKVNIEKEIENGVSGGALYLKVKLREVFPPKPNEDTVKGRKLYVKFYEYISDKLEDVKTFEEFKQFASLLSNYNNWFKDVAFTDDEYEEYKISIQGSDDIFYYKWHEFVNNNFPSITRGRVWNFFGSRMENFIKNTTEATIKTYDEAFDKEEVTIQQSNDYLKKTYLIDSLESTKNDLYEAESLKSKSIEDIDAFFQGRRGDVGYYIGKGIIKGKEYAYYSDCQTETMKKWYLDKYIKRESDNKLIYEKKVNEYKHKYRPKENDYKWAIKDKKKADKDEKLLDGSDEKETLKINTYLPLNSIVRKGGILVTEDDVRVESLSDKFSFKNIEFGKSLHDKDAAAHIRHFIASIADLGDILNMDISQLNNIGGLSIGFASRGHGKAAAHYEPLRKIINITKARGGGAVAHEYFHYLDNIIPVGTYLNASFKSNISDLIYDSPYYHTSFAPDKIQKAVKEISSYIFNKRESNKTKTSITVFAQKDKKYLLSHILTSDIESSFIQLTNRYRVFRYLEDLRAKEISILGYIVHHFGYESYDFQVETLHTAFYSNSKKMKSNYWIRPHEMFARAFECYVYDKLEKAGRENNYLVSGCYFNDPSGVYPEGEERKDLFNLFDNLMTAIKEDFKIGDFVSWTDIRTDEFIKIDDEKEKSKKKESSNVVTDEEGVVINSETDKTIEIIGSTKEIIKDKYKKLLELLDVETFEYGGVIQDNLEISDKIKNKILNLHNY